MGPSIHCSYLADTFIQKDIQLIRLSRGQSTLEQCGFKGLAQRSNSCVDLIMATPGLEPTTFRVPVEHLSHQPAGLLPPQTAALMKNKASAAERLMGNKTQSPLKRLRHSLGRGHIFHHLPPYPPTPPPFTAKASGARGCTSLCRETNKTAGFQPCYCETAGFYIQ